MHRKNTNLKKLNLNIKYVDDLQFVLESYIFQSIWESKYNLLFSDISGPVWTVGQVGCIITIPKKRDRIYMKGDLNVFNTNDHKDKFLLESLSQNISSERYAIRKEVRFSGTHLYIRKDIFLDSSEFLDLNGELNEFCDKVRVFAKSSDDLGLRVKFNS